MKMNPKPKKLLERVREIIRRKHYSPKTEQAYLNWIKQYILFHDKKHPQDMAATEVEAFLTYLAVERKVAASTQNQALSAILFLYREVLGRSRRNGISIYWRQKTETSARCTHKIGGPTNIGPFVW
jgi:site-specific recombinase XerD